MKKKFLLLLGLIFILPILFLYGCGNPYKNMKLSLSETEVNIELNNEQETEPVSVIASVSGVDKKISKKLVISTQSNCVRVTSVMLEDETTEILITATSTVPENSAVITVKTLEGDKTAYINVNIKKAPTEMLYNAQYKPAISINSQMQLNGAMAVVYGENDTDATEKDVVFSLKNNYDNLGIELSETGVLSVKDKRPEVVNGVSEIVIVATNKANSSLQVEFPVRVLEPIKSESEIYLELDDEEVKDELYIKLNEKTNPNLVVRAKDTQEDYVFEVVSKDESVVKVTKTQDDMFELLGQNAKSTTIQISCYVLGYEDFYSFTFEKIVKNVYIPKQINVTHSGKRTEELALFSEYKNSNFGTEISFDIEPNGVTEETSTLVLRCENDEDKTKFERIQWLNANEEIVSIEDLENGISLYASFKGGSDITELDGLVCRIESKYFKDVYSTFRIKVYNSIKDIKISGTQETTQENLEKESRILIEKNKTEFISVELTNALNNTIAISSTDLMAVSANELVATVVKENNEFYVTGLSTGEAKITFYSQNGTKESVIVKVFVPLSDSVNLDIPKPSVSSYVASLDQEESVFNLKMFVDQSITVKFEYNSDATVIKDFGTMSSNEKFTINTRGELSAKEVSDNNEITLSLIGWNSDKEEKKYTFTINLSIVEGLGDINFKFEKPYTNEIYTKNSVGYFYNEDKYEDGKLVKSLSKTILSVDVASKLLDDSKNDNIDFTWIISRGDNNIQIVSVNRSEEKTIKYYINGVEVENFNGIWEDEEDFEFEFSEQPNGNFTSLRLVITAPESIRENSRLYNITVNIRQYDVDIAYQKQVKLISALTVGSITVQNLSELATDNVIANATKKYKTYFDIRDIKEFILENDLSVTEIKNAIINNTTISKDTFNNITVPCRTPKISVDPSNARNTRVRFYALYLSNEDEKLHYVEDDSIIINETTGKFYPTKAGTYYIYIISEDNILSIKQGLPERFGNYTAIRVEVADGSEENPFNISTYEELKNINKYLDEDGALTYHYKLVENINGNNEEFTPIGIVDNIDIGFSASINFNSYTVSNITIKGNYDNVGLISKLNSGAELKNVSLRNITVETNSTGNVGLLVGENKGTITGSYENWQNNENTTNTQYVTTYNYSNFNIQGTITAESATNVGGLIGLNKGTISNVSVKATITGGTNVGGLVGCNNEVKDENNNSTATISTCQANCIVTGVNAGGLVGVNNDSIEYGQVELYSNEDIITGTTYAGGIAGINNGVITLSYARDFVQDERDMLVGASKGVLVGYNASGAEVSLSYGMCANEFEANFYGEAEKETTILQDFNDVYIKNAKNTNNKVYITKFDGENYSFGYLEPTIDNVFLDGELIANPVENIPNSITISINTNETFFETTENKLYLAFLKTSIINDRDNRYDLNEILTVAPKPEYATNLTLVAESNNIAVVQIVGTELVIVGEGNAVITIKHIKNQLASYSFTLHVVKGVNNIVYSTSIGEIGEDNSINANIYSHFSIIAQPTYGDYNAGEVEFEVDYDSADLTKNDDALIFEVIQENKDGSIITLTPYIEFLYNDERITFELPYKLILTVKCLKRAVDITVTQNTQEIFPIDETSVTVNMITSHNNSSQDENEEDTEIIKYELVVRDSNGNALVEDSEQNYYKNYISIIASELTAPQNYSVEGKYYQTKQNYVIRVSEEYKSKIDKNLLFEFKFYSSMWGTDEQNCPIATYTLTIKPQKLINIGVEHYPNGNGPYSLYNNGHPTEPEVSTSIIISNRKDNNSDSLNTGILQLNLHPIYAKINSLTVVSSYSGGDKITFEQVKYEKINIENSENEYYEIVSERNAQYTANGGLSLVIDNHSENGLYYLRTFIASIVPENTVFTLTITAKGTAIENNVTKTYEIVRDYSLIVKNVANAEIQLDESSLGFVYYDDSNVENEIYYVVKGAEQKITFVEHGFDADNIDVKVNNEVSSYISFADNKKIMQPNGDTYYNYVLNTSNFNIGETYIIQFTTTATTNGISNIVRKDAKIKIVDCFYKDISFTVYEMDNSLNPPYKIRNISSSDVPYGGYSIFIISANKIELKDGQIKETQVISKDLYNNEGDENLQSLITTSFLLDLEETKAKLIPSEDKQEFKIHGNLISSTSLSLKCGYNYNNNGVFEFKTNGVLENYSTVTLSLNVIITASYDNPIPIYNEEEFKALKDITTSTDEKYRHYILMNDITLENYKPMDLNILSLDGNGYTIYIKSFELSNFTETDTANIGVFNQISEETVLKNIHISYAKYKSYGTELDQQEKFVGADLSNYANVNVGLFAITNYGILNNCMVSTYNGTDYNTSIQLSYKTSNANVDTSIFSLFVVTNYGNITNSAVNNKIDLTETISNALIEFSAPGQLSGFVNENRGVIASCSAKGFKLNNTSSRSDGTITAGFVGYNSNNARISFSYANGFGNFDIDNIYSLEGTALLSNGAGAGFVFTNRGNINDCYANISIQGIKAQAGGFVYHNYDSGNITDCVSASLTTQNSTSSSLFCAKDNLKRSLNSGKFSYCYVYNQIGNINVITDNDEGLAILDNTQYISNSSYHFTTGENMNWSITNTNKGPFISIANKTIERKRELNTNDVNATDTTQHTYSYKDISYGNMATNPYIIDSIKTFNTIISTIVDDATNKSNDIEQVFKNKYFLFVNDIDFIENNILTSITSSKTFSGIINGNGFALKNISIINNSNNEQNEQSTKNSIGLFSAIESISNPTSNSIILNLEINIDEVTATKNTYVGALAGKIENTTINNVHITAVDTNSSITGKNIVGGLVGLSKNSQIYNSTNTAVSVVAEYSHSTVTIDTSNENTYSMISTQNSYTGYSYAGGLVGVIEDSNTNDNSLCKVTVSDNIQVRAENAGGIVGYLSGKSTINDAEFIAQYSQPGISNAQGIFGLRNAGGIVAHSCGTVIYARLDFSKSYYATADNLAKNYNTQVGLTNLFARTNYRVGGLVGYLTGGSISYSYSRVAVSNSSSYIAGGIVGERTNGTLHYIYTTGNVNAGRTLSNDMNPYYAGFIGFVKEPSSLTIEKCYSFNNWLSDNTSKTNSNYNDFANYYSENADYDYINTSSEAVNPTLDYANKIANLKNYLNGSCWDKTATFPRLNLYK